MLFILSSVDRYLGFYLGIVNNSATNIGLFEPLFLILWGIYLVMELVDHMVILCGSSELFSMVAAAFYILTNDPQGLQFCHILTIKVFKESVYLIHTCLRFVFASSH